MTIPGDAQQKIGTYLKTLRNCLRDLPEEEALEIVEELRSHILDKVAAEGAVNHAAVDRALNALGNPEELAGEYLTDSLLIRARTTRSPSLILRGLFRWATLSIVGFIALLAALCGYFVAGAFFLCAMMKIIHPQAAGLWLVPQGDDTEVSLHLGFGPIPSPGRELLGWWVIPIGLIAGMGLVFLTFHFGLWCIRRWRPVQVRGGGESLHA